MENTLITIVVVLVLFIVCRELNTWYWKIDERIKLQRQTNFLLEKISLKLGADDNGEITVEDKKTGVQKKITISSHYFGITIYEKREGR